MQVRHEGEKEWEATGETCSKLLIWKCDTIMCNCERNILWKGITWMNIHESSEFEKGVVCSTTSQ